MRYLLFVFILIAGMALSVWAHKLTVGGALTGGLIGFLIFCGAGWTGIFLMVSFFVLGVLATSWKKELKESLGIAEENKGRRHAGQVLANAGSAAILGGCAWIFPHLSPEFHLMIAACFSSATADTLSSELGSVYGNFFYNILSFRKDRRGLDGVVSIEGIFWGMAGSTVIALIYSISVAQGLSFLFVLLSGTVGNLADSVLGATLERYGKLKNDSVNFLNTLVAALTALLLFELF